VLQVRQFSSYHAGSNGTAIKRVASADLSRINVAGRDCVPVREPYAPHEVKIANSIAVDCKIWVRLFVFIVERGPFLIPLAGDLTHGAQQLGAHSE
jgi:hypothetical protein